MQFGLYHCEAKLFQKPNEFDSAFRQKTLSTLIIIIYNQSTMTKSFLWNWILRHLRHYFWTVQYAGWKGRKFVYEWQTFYRIENQCIISSHSVRVSWAMLLGVSQGRLIQNETCKARKMLCRSLPINDKQFYMEYRISSSQTLQLDYTCILGYTDGSSARKIAWKRNVWVLIRKRRR